MSERQANAQPCFTPLTMKGSAAGRITLNHMCNPFDPMVSAAREKIGGTARTPLSVEMTTDQTVPMTTTNSIAISVCPNQSNASGTQHTLGSVCNPSASTPMVSCAAWNLAVSNPRGMPAMTPTTYPMSKRFIVTQSASKSVRSSTALCRYFQTSFGSGNSTADQTFHTASMCQ